MPDTIISDSPSWPSLSGAQRLLADLLNRPDLTGDLPADVLLSLYRENGAEWMRANVPADWEARRIWGHDWLEHSPKDLLNHSAYSAGIGDDLIP